MTPIFPIYSHQPFRFFSNVPSINISSSVRATHLGLARPNTVSVKPYKAGHVTCTSRLLDLRAPLLKVIVLHRLTPSFGKLLFT